MTIITYLIIKLQLLINEALIKLQLFDKYLVHNLYLI